MRTAAVLTASSEALPELLMNAYRTLILQIKKPRLREREPPAQGHTAAGGGPGTLHFPGSEPLRHPDSFLSVDLKQ